jgi:small subunit ribosomal protein S1
MVSMATENNNTEESFAALFEESLKHEDVKEGDIVKGRVIHVGKDHVVVDIGYKSEGTIPLYEFTQADGTVSVKEGDEIDVFLESRENEDGLCVLSKEKADRLKVWDEISGACERDELIEGTISARVKGGLSVTIRGGVKAFLPGSQVDLRPVRNLDAFIGKQHRFKVIKFNKKRGNIVLSRRVLLEKERAELKEMTLEKLKEGQIVEGIVKNLTEYGAFIDLGGIDGLLPHHRHVVGPRHAPVRAVPGRRPRAREGVEVQRRHRAGLAGSQADQRGSVDARADEVPARHRRARQGRLAQGLRRVHRAGGGHRGPRPHLRDVVDPRVKHPSKVVAVGDTVEAVVLDIDPRQNRISLGIKQLEPNPFASLKEKYPPGTVVKGVVRNIADFGIFVEIEEGIDGLVHVSDLSWTQRVKHPSELYPEGRRGRVGRAEHRLRRREAEGVAGHQAAGAGSVGSHPLRLPGRQDRRGQGHQGARLRRLRGDREGRRGLIHVSEFSEERVEDAKTFVKPASR